MPSLKDFIPRVVFLVVVLVIVTRMLAWLLSAYGAMLCLLAFLIIVVRATWFYTRRY